MEESTKGLIKEHMAKIIAEQICKDQAIIEQAKAEILHEFLPAAVKQEPKMDAPIEASWQDAASVNWIKNDSDNESVQETKMAQLQESEIASETKNVIEPIAKTEETETPKPEEDIKQEESKYKLSEAWKRIFLKEPKDPDVKKFQDFTYNAKGLPDKYKSILSKGSMAKTMSEGYAPQKFYSYPKFFPTYDHLTGFNKDILAKIDPRDVYDNRGNSNPNLPKSKEMEKVKLKPVDDILKEFEKAHEIPADVAELLNKGKSLSDGTKNKPSRQTKQKRAAKIVGKRKVSKKVGSKKK